MSSIATDESREPVSHCTDLAGRLDELTAGDNSNDPSIVWSIGGPYATNRRQTQWQNAAGAFPLGSRHGLDSRFGLDYTGVSITG